jgi:hypothetical protein
MLMRPKHLLIIASLGLFIQHSPANNNTPDVIHQPENNRIAIISVADQKMRIKENGQLLREFPVSTSKFGLGDCFNSYRTPLGHFEVAQRIGHNVPLGGIFYRRNFSGKYYDINNRAIERASRDSILSRIIWLRGLEDRNRNAYQRGIYIHGTNQESLVGRPVSYGCIRMKNRDVVEAFELLTEGTRVVIQTEPLPKWRRKRPQTPENDALPESLPSSPSVLPVNAQPVSSNSENKALPRTNVRSLTRPSINKNTISSPAYTLQTMGKLIMTSSSRANQKQLAYTTDVNAFMTPARPQTKSHSVNTKHTLINKTVFQIQDIGASDTIAINNININRPEKELD